MTHTQQPRFLKGKERTENLFTHDIFISMKKKVFTLDSNSKNRRKFLACFLLFFLSVTMPKIYGQVSVFTGLPLYETGKVFLKIKETSTVDLTNYPTILNDSANALLNVLTTYSVTLVEKPFTALGDKKLAKTYRITFSDTIHADNFVIALENVSSVEYAERVAAMYPYAVNDPIIPYHLGLVNANGASNIHIATGNAIVAIVDDAVLTTHEDLSANISTNNWDASDSDSDPKPPLTGSNAAIGTWFSHGTAVAGIAGGVTNNGIGIASVGYNNKLMCVKTRSSSSTQLSLPQCWDGVVWAAANGAHVINMSWGGEPPNETYYNIIVAAKNAGAILVAAAGNTESNNPNYPAAYGEGTTGQTWELLNKRLVIAVAALDANNNRGHWVIGNQTFGSSFGSWVDISAYGSAIQSTTAYLSYTNRYSDWNGTSMAAPIVSGIAGVMKSYNMSKTADEIIDCILYTAYIQRNNTSNKLSWHNGNRKSRCRGSIEMYGCWL